MNIETQPATQYCRPGMATRRRRRYDRKKPGIRFSSRRPDLLEKQILRLHCALDSPSGSPAEFERSALQLDKAIADMAAHPELIHKLDPGLLSMVADSLREADMLRPAEIIIDRALILETSRRVIGTNLIVILKTAGMIKRRIGKIWEASSIWLKAVHAAEHDLFFERAVSEFLCELAECQMDLLQYAKAADTYTRVSEYFGASVIGEDDWPVRHRRNQAALAAMGFPPNPQRHRPISEIRYGKRIKILRDKFRESLGMEI